MSAPTWPTVSERRLRNGRGKPRGRHMKPHWGGARRRLQGLVAVLVVGVTIASGLTLFAFNQASLVERELAAAAISNLSVDPERSILLALRAIAVQYTSEAESALHHAV